MTTDLFNDNGATFSACRKYRYALWRIWDDSKPLVAFIGLNPSTANEAVGDPTITRVVNFARRWGFGGVYMLNCYAYVSTRPQELLALPDDPVNDATIDMVGGMCEEIIFAWGSFKIAKSRALQLAEMFPCASALQINKDGSPKHPLYVRGDITRIPFRNISTVNNQSPETHTFGPS